MPRDQDSGRRKRSILAQLLRETEYKGFTPIPREQWPAFVERLRSDDPAARDAALDEMIVRHTAMVRGMARQLAHTDGRREAQDEHLLADLIGAGHVGLCDAAARYDAALGTPFVIYSKPFVRAEMLRELARHRQAVTVKRHDAEELPRVRRTVASLAEALGRAPTDAEVAVAANRPASLVAVLRPLLSLSESALDAPAYADAGGSKPGADIVTAFPDELLAEDPAEREERQAEASGTLEQLMASAGLSPRTRRLLALRYGLGDRSDAGERTVEEVAQAAGMRVVEAQELLRVAVARLQEAARPRVPDRLPPWGADDLRALEGPPGRQLSLFDLLVTNDGDDGE